MPVTDEKRRQNMKDALNYLREQGVEINTGLDGCDTIAFIGYPVPPPETSKPATNGQEP